MGVPHRVSPVASLNCVVPRRKSPAVARPDCEVVLRILKQLPQCAPEAAAVSRKQLQWAVAAPLWMGRYEQCHRNVRRRARAGGCERHRIAHSPKSIYRSQPSSAGGDEICSLSASVRRLFCRRRRMSAGTHISA